MSNLILTEFEMCEGCGGPCDHKVNGHRCAQLREQYVQDAQAFIRAVREAQEERDEFEDAKRQSRSDRMVD